METLAVPEAERVAAAVRSLEGPAAASLDAARPVVVLDIETSGLGASLVPFMAAVAWHERGRMHLMQWTLHDGAAERAFLADVFACLDGILRPGTRLLSYNGKSFDLPRLRVRAQRLALGAGARGVPSLGASHLDLVIPARRVLKGALPNCRLSTLEAELLGHKRRGDMGGMEIAELWERMASTPGLADALAGESDHDEDDDALDPFLREDLAAAQLHNRGDVWALCSVATAVAQRLERPQSLAEAMGAANHLRQIEAPAAAIEVLHAFVEEASPVRPVWVDAALLLADLHRSEGQHGSAAALWRRVCKAAPGHLGAHESLAKHLEHKERRPDLALEVARASLAPCPKRIARLEKKVARQ
ncbi:MAG: ribonuclease H-like domain-containing protein [Nannocystaceae bacterium]|nr:ribonuclease H-like domain-containing protein [bacterium]